MAEPALSFVYNPNKSLFEQFTEQQALNDGEASGHSSQQQSTDGDGLGDEAGGLRRRSGVDASAFGGLGDVVGPSRRPASMCMDATGPSVPDPDGAQVLLMPPSQSGLGSVGMSTASSTDHSDASGRAPRTFSDPQASAIFGAFALFEGSPTYKQRRKPGAKKVSPLGSGTTRNLESSPGVASLSGRSVSPRTGAENDSGSAGSRSRPNSSAGLGIAHEYPNASEGGPFRASSNGLLDPYGAGGYVPQSFSPYTIPTRGKDEGAAGSYGLEPNGVSAIDLTAAVAAQAQVDDGCPGGSKNYVCPLFSCGRLFKRYEHLVRN